MIQKDPFGKAVNDFEVQLQGLDSDYLLVNRSSDQQVNIKFLGKFKQQPVVWDAHIRTLSDYHKYEFKNLSAENITLRQIIEIEKKNNYYKINLMLFLKKIDDSAIQKAIIMVRNYKNLHIGRHEYGDIQYFD
ncbi:MAG: hypothetical protein OEY61_07115 [Gammaproteobacteria bacterium]|nr:hypothetical protein [Gammaproteobacteria bacterium]